MMDLGAAQCRAIVESPDLRGVTLFAETHGTRKVDEGERFACIGGALNLA